MTTTRATAKHLKQKEDLTANLPKGDKFTAELVLSKLKQATPEQRYVIALLLQEEVTTPGWLSAKLRIIPSKMRELLQSLEQGGIVFLQEDDRAAGGKIVMLGATAQFLVRREKALLQD